MEKNHRRVAFEVLEPAMTWEMTPVCVRTPIRSRRRRQNAHLLVYRADLQMFGFGGESQSSVRKRNKVNPNMTSSQGIEPAKDLTTDTAHTSACGIL